MGDYLGLIIALAAGLPLLALALVIDVRGRRRAAAELATPPQRDLATVDAHAPAYVTQAEIDALPEPSAGRITARSQPEGTQVAAHLAHRDFATTGDRSALNHPRVLLTGDPIEAFRELLTPLAIATVDRPLVIVATKVAPEVLQTLCANRRALATPVALVLAEHDVLAEIRGLVGGEVLSGLDLHAGYVPVEALGSAAQWTSTPKTTWVQTPDPTKA